MTPNREKADRLGICNAVGIFILILAAVAAVIVFIDVTYRSDTSIDQCAQLVRVFGFDRLSLVPSGRTLRMLNLPNSAVDWQYDPGLAGIQPYPAELILKAPNPDKPVGAKRQSRFSGEPKKK
ncbi:MAG: hypothetical protein JSW26_17320 [Desulfobacterales bacterium]|nr:MAG: hypothetical protein JSW26_17320 [Desulfobacterales bacterium]